MATSVGITASVLAERKLLNDDASQIILAAAVIDDVLGLIVLAVVSSVAGGILTAGRSVSHRRAGGGLPGARSVVWGPAGRAALAPIPSGRALARMKLSFTLRCCCCSRSPQLLYMPASPPSWEHSWPASRWPPMPTGASAILTRGVSELLVPFFLAGIGLNFDAAIFRSKRTASAGLAGAGCRDCQQSARVRRRRAFSGMANRAVRGRGHGAARGSSDDRRAAWAYDCGAALDDLQRDRVCGRGDGCADATAAGSGVSLKRRHQARSHCAAAT